MANPEQLSLLKSGVADWNHWRQQNPNINIDLTQADLSGADLSGANLRLADLRFANIIVANLSGANLRDVDLRDANLRGANLFKADLDRANLTHADLKRADLNKAYLIKANLSKTYLDEANLMKTNLRDADLARLNLTQANLTQANLTQANLTQANLTQANLTQADLTKANLTQADLTQADLTKANLTQADLTQANLRRADLTEADLYVANLSGANLIVANLSNAIIGFTAIANTDLSQTIGLETVEHSSSSIISTNTLQLSKGQIPASFLRGCGLNDVEIEYSKLYNPDLTNEQINTIVYKIYDLRATQAIQISPLFISYSHADTEFVNHIDTALTQKGVRFWRDIHDLKAGRIETQIDRAIAQNATFLLILSQNSLNSDWVQHEVRKARTLEKEIQRDVLCPIALDTTWKSANWPQRLMEQLTEYNILDFSNWNNDQHFQNQFAKLLTGLNLFYKKTE